MQTWKWLAASCKSFWENAVVDRSQRTVGSFLEIGPAMARREERQAVCRGHDETFVFVIDNEAATVSHGED
jgi:hypothetical protein